MARKLLFVLGLAEFAMFGFAQLTSDARIRQLRVPLPLNETTIRVPAMLWSAQTGIPTGVEGRNLAGKPTATGRVSSTLDLAGLSYMESIEELLKYAPDYQARFDGRFLILRLKNIDSDLDRLIPRFTLKGASLVEAAQSVWRIFEPGYVLPAHPAMPVPEETEYDRQKRELYNERFDPVINVDVTQAKVEVILTEIAGSYGKGCNWSVIYTSDARRFTECILMFYAPKGAQVSAGPRSVSKSIR